jgi:hypothetical protein
LASAIAASPIRDRSSASTTGEGDSSISFWCRREEEHVPPCVGDHLRLDVVSLVDVPLEEHLRPAEVRLRLARGATKGVLELLGLAHDVHPPAAAAERGLHEHRVADAVGFGRGAPGGDRLGRAGDDRDAHPVGRLPGRGLVAHHLDRVGGRADEREPRLGHGAREVRAFGKEAVARVHHRRPGLRRGLEDRAERQVGVGGERGSDPVRLVGHLHVQRVAVRVAVDGDRGVPELTDRSDDANGDLAAVRDQDPRFGHRLAPAADNRVRPNGSQTSDAL